jgi:hypothetical protein
LRRQGVHCVLDASGRVRVRGLRRLAAEERAALLAAGEQVQQLLERRAQRRAKQRQPQESDPMVPEPGRQVVGMEVRPGGRSRLLYADETQAIPVARCRVLQRLPYGWSK